jgi:Bacteriophage lambda head decoration protein D
MATTTFFAGPKTQDDLIVHLSNPVFNNEMASVAAATAIQIGTVLGQITASKLLVPWAPAAANGSEIVCGVSLEFVPATAAAPTPIAYVESGEAILKITGLEFAVGVTTPQRLAAIAALKAKFIKVR